MSDATTEPRPDEDPEEEPKVFAIKKSGSTWILDRRGALKGIVATGTGLGVAGCGNNDDKDDDDDDDGSGDGGGASLESGEPTTLSFRSDGSEYQIVDFKNYNNELPATGSRLFVIGHVKDDYYFREFDAAGKMVLNQHESGLAELRDRISILKRTVRNFELNGGKNLSKADQSIVKTCVSSIKESPTVGRRMQGGASNPSSPGRRLQGASGEVVGTGNPKPNGKTSGRRMQGTSAAVTEGSGRRMQAAGQYGEESHNRQRFGDLTIGTKHYSDVKVLGVYNDGSIDIEHSRGKASVQTEQLSELVRMQLPAPTTQPDSKVADNSSNRGTSGTSSKGASESGSASPSRPTPPRPTPPSTNPRPSPPRTTRSIPSYSHYWRPN